MKKARRNIAREIIDDLKELNATLEAGIPLPTPPTGARFWKQPDDESECMNPTNDPKKILYDGKHIRLASIGKWEFAERKKVTGIVGIVAVTDDGKLLLIEQYRVPVGKVVIEIPAGLAGDVEGQEMEELTIAARRELLEETGYEAAEMIYLADGAASAGITDEVITLFRATGVKKTGAGEGDGSEQITTHEVPVGEVMAWLEARRREGKMIDLKVYGALYFATAAQ